MNPFFLPSVNKITWLRKSDIATDKGDLWIADWNGNQAKVWLHDVGLYAFFPSR